MLDYRHLSRMTDENGLLQFSRLSQPNPDSGYTLDDNARALILSVALETGHEQAKIYLSYLNGAQHNNGWSNLYLRGKYYNAFDSEDSLGRAILACAIAGNCPWDDIRIPCHSMLKRYTPRALKFTSPRAMAYVLLGLCRLSPDLSGDYSDLLSILSNRLLSLYEIKHSNGWLWFEDYITYCNGILPQSLLAAYQVTEDKRLLIAGRDSLNFLCSILFREGYLNIIGNQGWYIRGGTPAIYDQQPVDAASTVLALLEAYRVTGLREHLDMAILAYGWYYGLNAQGLSLYDSDTGGCYDALTAEGVNLNQGAEAVLSLLLSDLQMQPYLDGSREYDLPASDSTDSTTSTSPTRSFN